MWFKMLSGLNKSHKHESIERQPSPLVHGLAFTIRHAYPADASALRRLAALDSQRPLEGRVVVAEVEGEIWAAISVEAPPRVIADPFKRTAALVALLELHLTTAGVLAPRAHIPARGARRSAAAPAH